MSAQLQMTADNHQFLASALPAQPRASAATGITMRFGQDREIFGEGDRAETYYKVVSGVVRTCKFLSDGRRQVDGFYVSGDIFGLEIGTEYSLSAEAVCDCTLVAYRWRRGTSVSASEAGDPSLLFGYAMEGLARAQEHALLLGRKSAIEKVVTFLLKWAESSTQGNVAAFAMTRQDIGDYLGLTVETVSRTLSHLEREGLIELPSARQIILTDIEALQDLNE